MITRDPWKRGAFAAWVAARDGWYAATRAANATYGLLEPRLVIGQEGYPPGWGGVLIEVEPEREAQLHQALGYLDRLAAALMFEAARTWEEGAA